MSSQAPAFVRTLVPFIVGPLVARAGFDVTDPNTLAIVTAVSGYLWYVLVHTVELRYPQFGYLLGIAKAPAYSTEPAPSPGPGEEVEAVVVPDEGDVDLGTALIVVVLVLLVLMVVGYLPR